jgi:hypothetical protein
MTKIDRVIGALAFASALLPLGVGAQEPAPQEPPPGPPVEPELVFEREVFQYPSFTRRNPFVPLEGAGGEIRFEQLTLIGIIMDPDPARSVALLTTGGVTVAEDGTVTAVPGDAYNGRVGQRIGNTTIREIQRDRVIVDVEEFGLTDRRTMVFLTRRPGGSQ